MRFLIATSLLILAAPIVWAQPSAFTAETVPALESMFARESGWTGADGDYSVKLPDGRIIWLFSDTWIGRIVNGGHRDSVIIDNSVGIQTKDQIEFSYGTADGKTAALFRQPGAAFWIYDGVLLDGRLELFLQRVDKRGDDGFRHTGTVLAKISNPSDPPAAWKVEYLELPFGKFTSAGDTIFGSAILRSDGYVYVYGTSESIDGGIHKKDLIAARVRERKFNDFGSWRFFDGKRWRRDWRVAAPLADGFANEFSVFYVPKLRKYVAVHTLDGISPDIVFRTARTPVGPWSAPQTVFRCPEAEWEPNIVCYAAKGHASLSGPENIVISYVASSTDFWQIATDARLYRPRFVRIMIP